jgi:hypothetical protein
MLAKSVVAPVDRIKILFQVTAICATVNIVNVYFMQLKMPIQCHCHCVTDYQTVTQFSVCCQNVLIYVYSGASIEHVDFM